MADIVPKEAIAMMETVLVRGDLHQLSAPQRLDYYRRVCESLGLNPLTKPFQYITLNGRLVLYAAKDCTEQLRRNRGISIESLERETHEALGIYVVTVKARDRDGRTDIATGVVPIAGLHGEALANAYMKAETKAKRRVTLSIAGLGILDESEADSVPGASVVQVDMATGEVKPAAPPSVAPERRKRAARAPAPQAAMTTSEQDAATVTVAQTPVVKEVPPYPDILRIPARLSELQLKQYMARLNWTEADISELAGETFQSFADSSPGMHPDALRRDYLVDAIEEAQRREAQHGEDTEDTDVEDTNG